MEDEPLDAVPVDRPPPGSIRHPSGLISVQLRAGTGDQHPQRRDHVRVFMRALHRSGGVDWAREEIIFIKAGGSWVEPLQQMVVGERRRFYLNKKLTAKDYRGGNSVF